MNHRKDPYIECPFYETDHFLLRLIQKDDTEQLLRCYSNKDAVQFMNADNCTNDFYYPTMESMQQAVDFWIYSYQERWFIRFTIIDKSLEEAIGTVEMFRGDCGVLRVDVSSEYEKADYLSEIYRLAVKEFFQLFDTTKMVTKAVPEAVERRKALEILGWSYIDVFRIYNSYYERVLNDK